MSLPPPPRPQAHDPLRDRLLPGSQDEEQEGGARPAATASQAGKVLSNLINAGIGTSTVAMPLAVRTAGLGVTAAAFTVQAVSGVLSNHILSRESARDGAGSYHDIMSARFGKWGARAVAAAQVVNSLGKTVVWLIILADLLVGSEGDGSGLLPLALRTAGYPGAAEAGWWLHRWLWVLLLAALAIPACTVHSLSKLSGISLIGDAAVALMAASGVGLAVVAWRQGKAHGLHWKPDAGAGSRYGMALEVASVFPVITGAAFTQNNIHTVMGELRPYRQGLLDATQAVSRLLTVAIFLCIGISNALVFGPSLQPDILLNYGVNSETLQDLLAQRIVLWLSVAVKLSFLVNGLLSLPMYLYPAQRNVWDALPQQDAEERMDNRQSFALTNIASLAGCALVAVLVPSVWKPLKLLGGTAVSCMSFVFPGLIIIGAGTNVRSSNWDRVLWALGFPLVVFGLLQAAASIAAQFK